jgi:hypothetical protein
MNILVLGNKGSTGRRYEAIIKHMKIDVIGVDLGQVLPPHAPDAVIIATPTEFHIKHIEWVFDAYGPIKTLVEKPISKDLNALIELRNKWHHIPDCWLSMVNNWSFAGWRSMPWQPGECQIMYNCYNAGRDNDLWDMIQLVYLSRTTGGFAFEFDSPFFTANINGEMISLTDIERSYYTMIECWLQDEFMWDLDDAIEATRKVTKCLRLS